MWPLSSVETVFDKLIMLLRELFKKVTRGPLLDETGQIKSNQQEKVKSGRKLNAKTADTGS